MRAKLRADSLNSKIVEIKQEYFSNTSDAGGNVVICEKVARIPIALKLDTSHYIYSFFWAGNYWYARISSAYNDTHYPIKNATISGTIYYAIVI